ncbi:PDZ and LIM domain protein 7 [Bagarius yarrelli]|uniref:PDZ and LIM domain protein 7 n=1 Tax=Bagarius yarrelli TaxID=175774 RepID=A0A556TVI2_BAGYA|nr:PDZ and LIM domain protein 7 [Bagarius yarrelli]
MVKKICAAASRPQPRFQRDGSLFTICLSLSDLGPAEQTRPACVPDRSFQPPPVHAPKETASEPDKEAIPSSTAPVRLPIAISADNSHLHHGVTPCPSKPAAKPEGARASAPKSSSVSGGSSRPPWVTDPNFAERYRPDKTSTVVTQHRQPAQPTPEQNRSSILQAAQQNPEPNSGRTPLCAACNKIIRGRYVVALGRSWHPEEFTCCQCQVVLDEGGFFEEKGSVYCTKCYDNRYAPNCAKCKKIIAGEIMHALKMTYHVQCFVCAACKRPIRNQAFYMEEGEPYCERDYEKMFGTKCHGCDFKIDAGDRFLEALGYSWHDTCFVCALCHINLEGKTFYSKKDKPLCKGHAFSPL